MKMAPVFSIFILVLTVVTITSARRNPNIHSPTSQAFYSELDGKRLVEGLNLHPKLDINIVNTNSSVNKAGPGLVEWQLSLPVSGSPSPSDLGHHAGYYRLADTVDARMFYFFFESRSSKADPVVIWLTGGPGCSSELALFYENGPYKVTKDMTLVLNEFGWDKVSNLIYIDQPTGTGFSYSSSDDDVRHDETGVSNDLYNFLQAFFKAHPDYVKNDFFITGESYAGHYIPALAVRVNEGNKKKEGIHINLKGFGIGNGLTEPGIQYKAYPDFALENKLISKSDYESINGLVPQCESATAACGTEGTDTCMYALVVCQNIFEQILQIAGNINYYDIRKQCEGTLCYDFSAAEKFLNLQTTRKALGVGDIEWVSCSQTVHQNMLEDWMRNLEVGIPALLEEGINMLIYAGEYDLICNWVGNSRWVNAMEWSGQKEFVAAKTVPFTVDGAAAGLLKSHGPLTFLKVYNAGHMVPMDQPKNSLQMLQSWTQGKLAAN